MKRKIKSKKIVPLLCPIQIPRVQSLSITPTNHCRPHVRNLIQTNFSSLRINWRLTKHINTNRSSFTSSRVILEDSVPPADATKSVRDRSSRVATWRTFFAVTLVPALFAIDKLTIFMISAFRQTRPEGGRADASERTTPRRFCFETSALSLDTFIQSRLHPSRRGLAVSE